MRTSQKSLNVSNAILIASTVSRTQMSSLSTRFLLYGPICCQVSAQPVRRDQRFSRLNARNACFDVVYVRCLIGRWKTDMWGIKRAGSGKLRLNLNSSSPYLNLFILPASSFSSSLFFQLSLSLSSPPLPFVNRGSVSLTPGKLFCSRGGRKCNLLLFEYKRNNVTYHACCPIICANNLVQVVLHSRLSAVFTKSTGVGVSSIFCTNMRRNS